MQYDIVYEQRIHHGEAFHTLRSEQNGRHLADDNFKCVFLKENNCILIQISLKIFPRFWLTSVGLNNDRRQTDDKPLIEQRVA